MKKALHFFTSLVLLSGCTETPEPTPLATVSGTVGVRTAYEWASGASTTPAAVRATTEMRYILEVWTTNATPERVLRQQNTGTTASTSFDIQLVPGTYDFLLWADSGAASGYTTDSNSGLRAVTIDPRYTPSEARDAFVGTVRGGDFNTGFSLEITLKRPLARFVMRHANNFSAAHNASATYSTIYTCYDVLTGIASAPTVDPVTVLFAQTSTDSPTAGSDLLFIPPEGGEFAVMMTVGTISKQLDPLPLETNKQTIVTATFE